MTPGILVNRPDLSDDAVIESIRERHSIDGRHDADPTETLHAAMRGDADARALLGGLVLPPPSAPLSMHPQQLVREARSSVPRLGGFAWARRGGV